MPAHEDERQLMISSQQGNVPWSRLWCDIALLAIAILLPIISLVIDIRVGCHDWFARSGALTVLVGGYLAYRSLDKHYSKSFNNTERGFALKTSPNQQIIDRSTLLVSIAGTFVWG